MEISERELRQLTAAVDEHHRDGMRRAASDIAELHSSTRRFRATRTPATSRRSFLTRTAVGAGAVTIGAAAIPFVDLLAGAAAQEEPELTDGQIAGFAESVELAAVQIYGLAAASGSLAPPIAQLGTLFGSHHAEHADAFGRAAGSDRTRKPNAGLLATVSGQLANAKDQSGVLQIALDLENAAAATYLFALGVLDSTEALALAASILPVESQHAAVIGWVMSKPLAEIVPSFENQDRALDQAKFPTTTTTTSTTTTE